MSNYDQGYNDVLVKLGAHEMWKARSIVEKHRFKGTMPEGYKNYFPAEEEKQVNGILNGSASVRKKRKQIAKILTQLEKTRGSTTDPKWQK